MRAQGKKKLPESVDVDEIHENTSTQIIRITADKMKLILLEHVRKVENTRSWQTPLGIFITIVLVFCSTDFRDAFGLLAATWRAIFIISGLASLTWLLLALRQLRKSITIDDVLNIIKNKA